PELESGRRRYRRRLVPQNPWHKERRHIAAAALSLLRRPRQQSRLVNDEPGRNACDNKTFLAGMVSGNSLRRSPDGTERRTVRDTAVLRSAESAYRPADTSRSRRD